MILLEREMEQAQLQAAITRVADSGGQTVHIQGPAGIGKTELMHWTGEKAERQGFLVLRARGSDLERGFAFGLMHQLFAPLLVGRGTKRARLFSGAAVLAKPLLTGRPLAPVEPLDPAYPLLHGLYWLLANLATDRPVAVLVDDVHWSDPASARFLGFLSSRLEDLSVALILAARDGDPSTAEPLIDQLCAGDDVIQLRPAPLSAGSSRRLVELELGERSAPEFAAACHYATDGNPFLLRELLLYVRAERLTPSAANAEQLRGIAPGTVSRSALVRLAQLSAPATALAQAVAVLGDEAEMRHVMPLAELSERGAATAAASLIRAHLFEDRSPLRFIHPIIRASVYNDLTAPERSEAHGRAATVLMEAGEDPERIALHLLAAVPRGDPHVVDILRISAERALERGAPQLARGYLDRALSEPPRPGEMAFLRMRLGEALLSLGDQTGVDVLRKARESATDEHHLFESASVLARTLAASLRIGEAIDQADADAQRLRASGESGRELAMQLEAELTTLVMAVDYGSYAPLRGRLVHNAALSGGTSAQRLMLAATAMDVAGVAMYEIATQGSRAGRVRIGRELQKAGDLAEKALNDGALLEDFGTAHPGVFSAAFAFMLVDRLDDAARHLDMAIEKARRDGVVLGFVLASAWRSSVALLAGDIAGAAVHAEAATEAAQLHAWALPFPGALRAALDVMIERGELVQADQLLQSSPMAGGIPKLSLAAGVLFSRARLRIASGRVGEGIADLRELGDWLREWNFESFAMPWRSTLAIVLAGRDHDEAVALANEELTLAKRWDSPRRVGVALRACGLVHGGEQGLLMLRRSAETLERSPAKLEYARSLYELGAATRRAGRRAEAREILQSALETAHSRGAITLEQQARTDLLATGARPRRAMRTGIEAITPSERRICELAAQGRTNREIAQGLFVTMKTVERHLHDAYQKLDIDSREQLQLKLHGSDGVS